MGKKIAIIWPEYNAARALTNNRCEYHDNSPLIKAITTIGGNVQQIKSGQIYITPPTNAGLEDITEGLNVAFSKKALNCAYEAKLMKTGSDVTRAGGPFISIASKRNLPEKSF